MANKNRILHNDHKVAMVEVDDATVVEMGDFICIVLAGDVADDATLTLHYGCPPTYLVDAGDAAANRVVVAAQLIGIALAPSASGETALIPVGYNGTFILDQKTAAAIYVAENIEPYADATSGEDQTIVEGDTSIIAKCIKSKTSTSLTEVEVLLQPALMNVA